VDIVLTIAGELTIVRPIIQTDNPKHGHESAPYQLLAVCRWVIKAKFALAAVRALLTRFAPGLSDRPDSFKPALVADFTDDRKTLRGPE